MCNQCEALMINGVYCHEIGCPNSWMGEIRECKWCGNEFNPLCQEAEFCGDDCRISYYS